MTETKELKQKLKLKRSLISAFIVLNVTTVLISKPIPIQDQSAFRRFFFYYANWTKLLQSWNLFVPEPRRYASYYKVDVMFTDFTNYTWRRPYPTNWDFFYRHLCYNWQKYDLAATHMELPYLWDDIVNFIMHQDFITKPVKRVRLAKMVAPWPPPKESGDPFTDVSQLHWTDATVFVYDFEAKKYL